MEPGKAGHPPLYKTPELLQEAIDKYFNEGVTIRKVIVGSGGNKQLAEIPVPTITGLCYYLGFESRQSFYDYEEREGFSYTVKRARLFIEKEYEEQFEYCGDAEHYEEITLPTLHRIHLNAYDHEVDGGDADSFEVGANWLLKRITDEMQ